MDKSNLALAVSVSALLISALGLWESHRGGKVAVASSRASLHISRARIAEVGKDIAVVHVIFENVGAALAKDIHFRYRSMYTPPPGKETSDMISGSETLDIDDIPPRTTREDVAYIQLPKEGLKANWPTFVAFIGTLSFVDEATGETFTVDESFTGFINGNIIQTPEMFSGTLPPPDIPLRGKPRKQSPPAQ